MIDVPAPPTLHSSFEQSERKSLDLATTPKTRPSPVSMSVLACAYNEAQNLPSFLDAALKAQGDNFQLNDVVVVASGCTDSTPGILNAYAQRDPRVRPIFQEERDGKASALIAGFPVTTGDVVVVENPDTVPGERTFSQIAGCLLDSSVDVVCLRPVPVPRRKNFASSLSNVMWALHDEVSRMEPKAGEGYAFRRAVSPFTREPFEDDDALLSLAIRSGRLKAKYCPEAIVYLNPPTRFRDYLRQRLRNGRLIGRAAEKNRVLPSTWVPSIVVRSSLRLLRKDRTSWVILTLFMGLEIFLRVGAGLIAAFNPRPLSKWAMIETTKDRITTPEPRKMDPEVSGATRDCVGPSRTP